MYTVLITGGTGLVGTQLTTLLLQKGYKVIILTRKIAAAPSRHPQLEYALWNVEKQQIDTNAIAKADCIVHLAGAGVADKRWTKQRKQDIVNSRTQSSALLVQALQTTQHHVKAVISASAIGWYGADTNESKQHGFTEDALADTAFLGNTCAQWEASIAPVTQLGIRLVWLRTGIVLSPEGGALKEFLKPIKMGVAAILGNGNQVISWIGIHDLCNMFLFAIENTALHGAYNAVAPEPVNNRLLTLELAKKIRGHLFIRMSVPAWILNFILGEMSIEVLKSANVNCDKIKNAGFQFVTPSIQTYLTKTF